jgi:hypothetical protein
VLYTSSVRADYVWRELYVAALLEPNPEKIQQRVPEAKAAIDARLHELQIDPRCAPAERHAISEALAGLNLMQREIEIRSRS